MCCALTTVVPPPPCISPFLPSHNSTRSTHSAARCHPNKKWTRYCAKKTKTEQKNPREFDTHAPIRQRRRSFCANIFLAQNCRKISTLRRFYVKITPINRNVEKQSKKLAQNIYAAMVSRRICAYYKLFSLHKFAQTRKLILRVFAAV